MLTKLRRTSEDGSSSVESVLLIGVFAILIAAGLIVARVSMGEQTIQSAASAAAREASLSPTSDAAQERAENMARASIENAGLTCQALDVSIDSDGINAPLGELGIVSATVTCTIDYSDISFGALPGARTITATQNSPVDPYKERR